MKTEIRRLKQKTGKREGVIVDMTPKEETAFRKSRGRPMTADEKFASVAESFDLTPDELARQIAKRQV
jgi:hypothetical protein